MKLTILALFIPLVVWAQPENLDRSVRLPTGYTTQMVLVPAGSFPRGAEGEEFDEQPVRMIYLDAYLIDKYEVTVAQWNEETRLASGTCRIRQAAKTIPSPLSRGPMPTIFAIGRVNACQAKPSGSAPPAVTTGANTLGEMA
jgi:formylglycine-generating enzyme required for sulfatase activity